MFRMTYFIYFIYLKLAFSNGHCHIMQEYLLIQVQEGTSFCGGSILTPPFR